MKFATPRIPLFTVGRGGFKTADRNVLPGRLRWMSVYSPPPDAPAKEKSQRKKVTISTLHQQRRAGIPITMLTAYDYPTGRACERYGVDLILVGDSLAQVCLGYDSTTRLTLQEMLHHCRAVARGVKTPFLVADLPFGAYYCSPEDTMRNAVRLVQEGGAEAVKMEGGEELVPTVKKLTSMGIPVMAHIGLQPQRSSSLSGFKVQGKSAETARAIIRSAQALEDAGVFAMVLEAIPHKLGSYITNKLSVPTIGIGAGPDTSGQVLVWDDVMSTWSGHKPKFVRQFGDVRSEVEKGVTSFISAVRERSFPDIQRESYDMDEDEWKALVEREQERN